MSSAAEMTAHVRELCAAKKAPKQHIAWGDVARDLTRRVRALTGEDDRYVSASKVKNHWYGYLRNADADHLEAARQLTARQKELEAQREAQKQANQLLVVAHRLETLDASFHSEDVAALKRAAAVVGTHNRTLAED